MDAGAAFRLTWAGSCSYSCGRPGERAGPSCRSGSISFGGEVRVDRASSPSRWHTQGPDKVRRFTGAVDAFPILIDADNILGEAFAFKAIPNGILVAPNGRIDAIVAGKFDIRRPETRQLVETWLEGDDIRVGTPEATPSVSADGLGLLREAAAALRRDDRAEAIRLLKLAYPLDPDNYIIRKQLWAVENPERFYIGDIDKEWQRQQLERGL